MAGMIRQALRRQLAAGAAGVDAGGASDGGSPLPIRVPDDLYETLEALEAPIGAVVSAAVRRYVSDAHAGRKRALRAS